MSTRSIFMMVLLSVLGVVYAVYFTQWFHRDSMHIMWSRRPGLAAKAPPDTPGRPVDQVTFGFDGKYELTSVKVVRADDLATNISPYALWHLISDRHSVPTKALIYGRRPDGMKPAVPGVEADPLEPNVTYVLQVEADEGRIKAQTNFFTIASVRKR